MPVSQPFTVAAAMVYVCECGEGLIMGIVHALRTFKFASQIYSLNVVYSIKFLVEKYYLVHLSVPH